MPITPAVPLGVSEREDASGSTEAQGDVFGRKYSDTFFFFFARDVSQPRVLVSTGFLPNQAHPDDDRAYVNSISASNPTLVSMLDGTPAIAWVVTIGYATVTGNAVVGGPLAQPAKVTRKTTPREVIAATDYQGEPILNTAGVPYNPPLPKKDFESKYRIEKNIPEADFDYHIFDALVGKTNNSEWNGFAAKTLLLEPFDVPEKERDEESNTDFRHLVLELSHNRDTWVAKQASAGYTQLVAGKLVRIMDDKGEEKDGPTLLDEDGVAIPYPADASSIVIQEFELYEPVSYDVLDVLGTLTL